ncbi:MAG: hypothetical protein Fur0020_09070 [Thermodesulfovibrionia bacterium]
MQRSKILIYSIPIVIILTGLLIYQYGYLKISSNLSMMREEEAVRMEKLKRYNQLISERPMLEERLSMLKKRRSDANVKLIEAQTSALAGASLQEMVKGIFMSSGGIISSERIENTEERDRFRVINVTINGSVRDTNALKDIIYSIETRTPYLIVKNLDVRVKNFRKPTGELMVNLTVSALTSAK